MIILLVSAYHLCTISFLPPLFADEPWNGGRAVELLRSGIPFGPLDEGFRLSSNSWSHFPILPYWIFSFAVSSDYQINFLVMRLITLSFGFLTLGSIFYIVKNLVSLSAATLVLFLIGFDYGFFTSSHIARPDIMAMALGYTAIALYTRYFLKSAFISFLIGFLACISIEFQLRGLVFPACLFCLCLYDHGFSCFRLKGFYSFILGVVAAFLIYFYLHAAGDLNGFLSIFWITYGKSRVPEITDTGGYGILDQLKFNLKFTYNRYVNYLPFLLIVIPGLVSNLNKQTIRLLIITGSVCMFSFLIIKTFTHLNVFFPASGLYLLFAFIVPGIRRFFKAFAPLVLCIFILVFFYNAMLWSFLSNFQQWECNDAIKEDQQLINQIIPIDKVLMGPQIYWAGRQISKYYTWEAISFRRQALGETVSQTVSNLGPDYFIKDAQLDYFVSDNKAKTPWKEDLRIPKSELEHFLNNEAELIHSTETKCFGRLDMYKVKK